MTDISRSNLYLFWPSTVSSTISLFNCASTADSTSRHYADHSELCFTGRHAVYTYVLGWTMIVLYLDFFQGIRLGGTV